MAVLSGTLLHGVSVHMVRPAMLQVVEVSEGDGGTIFTLHSPTHSPRSWPVQSHCPLKIQRTSRTWNVAGAAFLKPSLLSPIGLDSIFFLFFFDMLASSWQILQCLSKRDRQARRAIKQCVDAGIDVSAAKHIRQAASGYTRTGQDYTHGCCVVMQQQWPHLGVY